MGIASNLDHFLAFAKNNKNLIVFFLMSRKKESTTEIFFIHFQTL